MAKEGQAARGETMPEGWMIDRQGTAHRSSPRRGLSCRSAVTSARPALIVGLLRTLNGAAMGKDVIDFNRDDASPTNTGQASSPSTSRRSATSMRSRIADTPIDDLRGSRRMQNVDRIWLPESKATPSASRTRATAFRYPRVFR
jgi:LDH2 family malate/lactate/ureidoglycolate dehydrogenase